MAPGILLLHENWDLKHLKNWYTSLDKIRKKFRSFSGTLHCCCFFLIMQNPILTHTCTHPQAPLPKYTQNSHPPHLCLLAYLLCSCCNCFIERECCSAIFVLALLSCSIFSCSYSLPYSWYVEQRGKQAEVVLSTEIRSSLADGVLADGACVWTGFTNNRVH